jgi:hypothetical protein
MKYLTTAVLLIGGVILMSQSGFAQLPTFVNDDLYLGFQNSGGGGTADYIINLGPTTNIVGSNTVVDLSSRFSPSLFNNTSLQGTSRQIFGGVLGANNSGNPSEVWGTQLRTSNLGNPALAGSSAPGGLTTGGDTTVAQQLSTLDAPFTGTGVLDGSKTWEAYVEPTLSIHSFWGNAGFNPDSSVSTNTVLYEDLWWTSSSSSRGTQPFIYVGYFTLDLTGGSPKLTFTSTNVPPSLTTKPVIVSVGKAGSTVTVVSSNAVPTFNYQLQYTVSLSPTSWISVGGSVVAGGTMVTNTDATATDSQRFYRVQAY